MPSNYNTTCNFLNVIVDILSQLNLGRPYKPYLRRHIGKNKKQNNILTFLLLIFCQMETYPRIHSNFRAEVFFTCWGKCTFTALFKHKFTLPLECTELYLGLWLAWIDCASKVLIGPTDSHFFHQSNFYPAHIKGT